jgi:hypothetical protein
MHLHSYRLTNFRRFQNSLIELASEISIFVGSNNSGKTSATQAITMFLSGEKDRFSMFDFSSSTWRVFNELGDSEAADNGDVPLPAIVMDLWFDVSEADLYLVLPILPSSDWAGNLVGMRIEFAAKNPVELIERYRTKKQIALERVAVLAEGAGAYIPWPKSLTDYLEKELQSEFEFTYSVLDRAHFNASLVANDGYVPVPLMGEPKGATVLKSLVRVDCLSAQRHLADSGATGGGARSEDLSRRLSRFYSRNLAQRDEDQQTLKALFDSEAGLNQHLKDVFAPTLQRIATLGYPGLKNFVWRFSRR